MTHRFSLLRYSNIKVYHDGAAMTLSAVDAILILTRTHQIADDAPFTSTEIERERLRLLTELLVSDCRVLMERLVDRR